MSTGQRVWVVHVWQWGGGGDDDRWIVAVCSTEEHARAIAADVRGSEIMPLLMDVGRMPQ